jgi:hypothetical protein
MNDSYDGNEEGYSGLEREIEFELEEEVHDDHDYYERRR